MFNWGILGTANINSKIIPFLLKKNSQKLIAVASRSLNKAKDYAEKFQIGKYYGTYEGLINSKEIDAIYISLPNNQHFHWSKMALLNGKHVLCEKPLVLSLNDALELTAISKSSGRLLMEGFMYRHHKQISEIKKITASGKIGQVQHIRSSFHFTIPEGSNIRMNIESGGGVMWDLGCYIVNLSNYIFDQTPGRVYSSAKIENGVDTLCSGILCYNNGNSTTFDCSFNGPRRNFLEIIGTNGILICERPYKGERIETFKIISDSGQSEYIVTDESNPYEKEFDNFFKSTARLETPVVSLAESISTVKTIEALIKSITTLQVVAVE